MEVMVNLLYITYFALKWMPNFDKKFARYRDKSALFDIKLVKIASKLLVCDIVKCASSI